MTMQESIREMLIELAFLASQLSGYQMPLDHDVAVQLTLGYDLQRCALFFEEKQERQIMPACYVFGTDTIFIRNRHIFGSIVIPDETNATVVAHSMVIHEIVHWLQEHNTDWGDDCASLIKREAEAYNVQRKYLEQHGIEMTDNMRINCEKE